MLVWHIPVLSRIHSISVCFVCFPACFPECTWSASVSLFVCFCLVTNPFNLCFLRLLYLLSCLFPQMHLICICLCFSALKPTPSLIPVCRSSSVCLVKERLLPKIQFCNHTSKKQTKQRSLLFSPEKLAQKVHKSGRQNFAVIVCWLWKSNGFCPKIAY